MENFKIQFTKENFYTVLSLFFGPKKPDDPDFPDEMKEDIMEQGLGVNSKGKSYLLRKNDWIVISNGEIDVYSNEDYKALFENNIN